MTVQAEVLGLIRELRDREGMSVLFIGHDLAVVAELCDRVAIMRQGRIVEQGGAAAVLSAPKDRPTTPAATRIVAWHMLLRVCCSNV